MARRNLFPQAAQTMQAISRFLSCRFFTLVLASTTVLLAASPALAARPKNPYSSFNLSGMNYGAMQWEKAQRQGKRVWPYYNTPSRSSYRGGVISGGRQSR